MSSSPQSISIGHFTFRHQLLRTRSWRRPVSILTKAPKAPSRSAAVQMDCTSASSTLEESLYTPFRAFLTLSSFRTLSNRGLATGVFSTEVNDGEDDVEDGDHRLVLPSEPVKIPRHALDLVIHPARAV